MLVSARVFSWVRSCALVFRCASLATDACAGLQVCALVAAPLELLVLDVRC